jgi:hypothetical protein
MFVCVYIVHSSQNMLYIYMTNITQFNNTSLILTVYKIKFSMYIWTKYDGTDFGPF